MASIRYVSVSRAARCFLVASVAFSSWWLVPDRSAADEPPPPSQQVRTDASVPVYVVALTGDVLAAVLKLYAARLEFAPGPHHVLSLRTGWERADGRGAALIELGYALAPLGNGVEGVQIGLAAGALLDERGARAVRLGGEGAYQYVWGGLALGFAVGAERQWELLQGRDHWRLRARLFLGWAWR